MVVDVEFVVNQAPMPDGPPMTPKERQDMEAWYKGRALEGGK
jgi:hypothetical protein